VETSPCSDSYSRPSSEGTTEVRSSVCWNSDRRVELAVPRAVLSPARARPTGVQGVAAYESPIFFGRVGVLATRWEPTGGTRDRFDVDAFYRTSDGGRTWALASKLRLQPASDLRVVSPIVWWLASRNAVYLTTTAGRRWARHAFRLGFRPLELSLTPVGARSAVLQTYNEPNRMRWFVTHDGGATFDRFTP
jgi:hypothetical protein